MLSPWLPLFLQNCPKPKQQSNQWTVTQNDDSDWQVIQTSLSENTRFDYEIALIGGVWCFKKQNKTKQNKRTSEDAKDHLHTI